MRATAREWVNRAKEECARGLQAVRDYAASRKKPQFVVRDDVVGQGFEAKVQFDLLGLNKQRIDSFFAIFHKISAIEERADGQIGLITFLRYFRFLNEEGIATPFAKHTFSLLDTDNSGRLDFLEFVTCLWSSILRISANINYHLHHLSGTTALFQLALW